MAALHIICDKNKDMPRDMIRAATQLREAIQILDRVRGAAIQAIDGVTYDPANCDLLALRGGYEAGDYASANHAAQRSFAELDSLWGQIDSSVRAALEQYCAIHAI